MALTEFEIRSARATEKPIKLFDGDGLYLSVQPNGSRWWATVTHDKARWMLSTFIYPRLGSRPIAEITAPTCWRRYG